MICGNDRSSASPHARPPPGVRCKSSPRDCPDRDTWTCWAETRPAARGECIYGHVPQYKNVPVPCESRSSILLWVMETPSFSMWKERLSQRSRGVEADACTAPLTRAVEEEQDDNHDCEKELEYIYESVGPDAAPRVAERSNAGARLSLSPPSSGDNDAAKQVTGLQHKRRYQTRSLVQEVTSSS